MVRSIDTNLMYSDMTAGGLSLRLGAGNVSSDPITLTSNGTYEGISNVSEGTDILLF